MSWRPSPPGRIEMNTIVRPSLEVATDLYNVLNLLNSRWGVSRFHGLTFGTDMLIVRGYEQSTGRLVYQFRKPDLGQVDDLASRWQMEASVRYRF
jgi:hypothetical protein